MPDPNNCLVHEHKVCFQFICKAGNTTIKRLLVDLLCNENEKECVFKRPDRKWKYCDKNSIPNDYLVIGFCRNPEKRLISCWKDKVNGKPFRPFIKRHNIPHKLPFEDFIKKICKIQDETGDQHFRPQTYDLNLERLNFLVKMESFEKDWEKVRELIFKHRNIVYPKVAKPENASIKEVVNVSKEIRELIENRYEADYRFLQYK
jgi:hypothetical protein